MAFKIKDGVRIGTVDVFNNAGELLVNAPAAAKWTTPRTITLAGDLTGNASIDGSANVTLTATVAANSVALGTDTTGNYVATVAAGTSGAQTGTSGLTIVAAAGEGTAATIAHADTSAQANLTASGRTYVTGLTFDTYGHVTGLTTGTETVVNSDTNTTYDISAATTTGGALLRLTAGGSGSGTDDVKFASGANITITQTDVNTITISGAESDTLQTVTTRGATTNVATVSLTATTASTTTATGALVVAGGVGVGGSVNVGGDLVLGGNLTVNGTTTTLNSITTTLDDPILTLGGDTAPTADDNKDRGIEFRYFDNTAKVGFFGYDDSTGKYSFLKDATNTAEVFSGTKAELDATVDWSNILSKPTFVTSVGGTGTVSGITLSGIVTSSGNLTLGGTLAVAPSNFASQTANTVLAAPNGSTGVPTFRLLTASDIPELTLDKLPSSAFKKSVQCATTVNITLSGVQTIDGIAVIAGDRVLVKNQTTASQNGIYVVAAGSWTRALDADSVSDIASAVVNIDSGTANGSELWTNTFRGTDVLNTTAMNWYEVIYNSGTWGISITGNAATATALQTARTIGGVSFNGTANINLPGVNAAGNQSTTGSAATLTTARTIAMTGDVSYTSAAFNGSGNVTGTATLATVNSNVGTFNNVTVNAKGLVTAASNVSYLTALTDTLQTVTTRGNTTNTVVNLTNTTNSTNGTTGALIVAGGLAVNSNVYVKGTFLDANTAGTIISARDTGQASVAVTTAAEVDLWPIATYRSAKYLVQITQGGNHQFSEIVVIHNGITTTMTEYAVVETAGPLGNFTSDVSGGNVRLLVTMGSATAATVNVQRTLMVI